MNKRISISVKTFLIILAIVAVAAWLAGCSKSEESATVQQGPYAGQNAIEVLESEGLFVNTQDLKAVCGYVEKLSKDGSIDDDDLIALAEKVGSDINKPLNARTAKPLGKVAGIAMVTYCPEFLPLFQDGDHI